MDNETEQIFLVNTAHNPPPSEPHRSQLEAPTVTQVNLENVADFSSVCRTCAAITQFLIPVFEGEGLVSGLAHKIHKHLPIQMCADDVLPRAVCYQCAHTLLAWHELAACCRQADAALRTRLANIKRHNEAAQAQEQQPTTSEEASKNAEQTEVEATAESHQKPAPPPYTPRPARPCDYCAAQPALTDYEEHLITAHSDSLFHCVECDTYVNKKDFIIHMSVHAVQYAETQEKTVKKKTENFENDSERDNQKAPDGVNSDAVIETSIQDENQKELIAGCDKRNTELSAIQSENGKNEYSPTRDCENGENDLSVIHGCESQTNEFTVPQGENERNEFTATESENERNEFSLTRGCENGKNEFSATETENGKNEFTVTLAENGINEFSDHSDTEFDFGPLPESVFEAIEDSQDSQPANSNETENNNCNSNPSSVNSPVEQKKEKHSKSRTCPICSKVYTASSSYFYHMKHFHRREKEHECDFCGRKFGTKSILRDHLTIHTGECRYQCKQCNKWFRSKASVYIHEQSHNGVKKFGCSECKMSFRWRTHLNRHMKRHSAERTHTCKTCNRAFSVHCDLLRHERTHKAGEIACAKCGVKFAQMRYLKVHMDKKHSAKS